MTTDQAPNKNFSDNPETKKYVTPFAFGVADDLLGKPLASPRQRLTAVIIDLVVVALLTTINVFFLALVMLFITTKSFFSLRGEVGRVGMRIALALTMFVSVVTIIVQVAFMSFDGSTISFDDSGVSVVKNNDQVALMEYKNNDVDDEFALLISALTDNDDKPLCAPGDECDELFFNALVQHLINEGYDYKDASALFSGVHDLLSQNGRLDDDLETLSLSKSIYDQRYKREHALFAPDDQGVSVVLLLQGFIADLGLSFGWAAVYFSVFTAWWKGQTVGKKLLGIKVVRIDGKRIDLWESFGRYGGYSAGVATGLLGFLQIYWDANRQAIQDKISETVVIRLN